MSGTKTAYNYGCDDGRRGKAFDNPYRHYTVGDNANQYCDGYLSGTREYNRHKAMNNSTWNMAKLDTHAALPYPGGMSKDRVCFWLASYYFHTATAYAKIILVLGQVFGVSDEDLQRMRAQANAGKAIRIVCRPSQFARFVIRRSEAGLQSMFKELGATLVPANILDDDWDVDVSKNKPY